MSETTTEVAIPKAEPAEIPKTEAPTHTEQSRSFAKKLIDSRASLLNEKVDKGEKKVADLDDNEFSLYTYKKLESGFSDKSYATEDSPGMGFALQTTSRDGEPVSIKFITGAVTEGDDKYFTCKAEDPSNPDAMIDVTVDRKVIAQSYLDGMHEEVASNFTGKEKDAVAWYAKGANEADNPISQAELTDLDNPVLVMSKQIDAYKNILQGALATIKAEDAADPKKEVNPQGNELENRLALIGIAESINGEAGLELKYNLLKRIAEKADPLTKMQLEQAIVKLEPQLDASKDAFQKVLDEAGIDGKDALKWQKALESSNPESVMAELAKTDTSKALVIAKGIFGEDFDINDAAKVDSLIDKVIDTTDGMTPEKRAALKKALKATKGAGWVLFIIAALAGGLALGVVAEGMKGQR